MTLLPNDPFELERFVVAQQDSYDDALAELRAGAKRSHWMWYIFPQGLGSGPMAERYAIRSRREATAYLAHPVLGPRLTACAKARLQMKGKTATQIMGYPDDLKLKSSITLFAAVSAPDSPFQQVLAHYFAGAVDSRTLDYIKAHP